MGLFDGFFRRQSDDEQIASAIKRALEEGNYTVVQGVFNHDYEAVEEDNGATLTAETIQTVVEHALPHGSKDRKKAFDVFLAHSSADKPAVRAIAGRLRDRGLRPWLDEEQIAPGTFFLDAIEQAISEVRAAAVFVGPAGLGRFQRLELRSLVSELVDKGLPVIPVLLPGSEAPPGDLLFLKQLNWVSFSAVEDDKALSRLIWGVTGQKQ